MPTAAPNGLFTTHLQNENAKQTTKFFLHNVVRTHGLPCNIVSDGDGRFLSLFWISLMDQFHIKSSKTAGFHPQANGQVERYHQSVKQVLRALCQDTRRPWPELLDVVEMALNNAVVAGTK